MAKEGSAEATIRDIKRKTRRKYSSEEKIRIVIEGLRGEQSVADLCRREGIAESLYYSWSKEFMEAGKARLAGNTKRQASSSEVDELRQENEQLSSTLHIQAAKHNVSTSEANNGRETFIVSGFSSDV
jgi:transposase